MTKLTAIYARQSLDKKDSLSIEGQIEQCKGELKQNETPVIYKDKGYSGKNTARPELQRLLNDIKLGKIGKVIVYKLDRISRNITDFYKLFEEMQEYKCDFVSATEEFDTTGMGKFVMGMLAMIAELERNNIQKRVKDNYYYRTATTGSWAGGPAPFGFKNGRNEHNKPTLIPIPEEQEAVELMFALYYGVEHYTLGQVARMLNDKGYKPHKRDVFDSVTVSKILQNPIYVNADKVLYTYFKKRKIKFLNSEEEWDGTRAAHIIGKKVGNANIRSYTTMEEQSVYLTNFQGFIPSISYVGVQERLAENQQFTRNNTSGLLEELGGKLKCGACKYAIKSYSQSTNGRPYLDCYANRSLHTCKEKYNKVNFWELQEKVGEEIQKQLDNLHGLWQERVNSAYKATEEIESKQAELDKVVQTFIKGNNSNDLTVKAVQSTVERLQSEINELEYRQQVALSSSGTLEIFLKHNLTLKESISKGVKYQDLTTEEKRQIIDVMIDKIYLTNDINTFEIAWKI